MYGLTKGQFSATADRGSKASAASINSDSVDRPRRNGAATRRHLRRALVLRRQGRSWCRSSRRRSSTRARPSSTCISPCVAFNNHARLDQELRLCARAQRGGEPARFHHRPRADHGRLRAGHGRDGGAARRLDAGVAQARRRLRRPRPARRHELPAARMPPRARSSPACSMSSASRRTCTAHLNTVETPLNALGEKELCPGSAALDKINAELAVDQSLAPRSGAPADLPLTRE